MLEDMSTPSIVGCIHDDDFAEKVDYIRGEGIACVGDESAPQRGRPLRWKGDDDLCNYSNVLSALPYLAHRVMSDMARFQLLL
jgi:hypothetical protein